MINVKSYNKAKNYNKLIIMLLISLVLVGIYQFAMVDFNIFEFTMKIRTPRTLSMIIAAFCIGVASIIFQTIINNRIVTPCLLGMNSLYILIHTSIAFIFGTSSLVATNKNISFILDIVVMGIVATIIYGAMFRKTKYNILYILLSGTVLATLFTSISNSMTRIMDPNEYDTLLTKLVAGFDHVNSEILVGSILLIVLTMVVFYKDIKILDVLSLGKNQSINLGVNYDRSVSRLLIAVIFFITIATALVGPISFLGLITANLSREIFKTHKHSYLMLGSFLVGVIILLFGQIMIEHVLGFGVLISAFIQVLGGGYFLYLILRSEKN